MGTGTSILLATAVVVGVGVSVLYLSKHNRRKVLLKSEKVDSISMGDVVGWFKSLNLDPVKHTPFICNNLKNFDLRMPQELNINSPYILLGVYNEKNNSLTPYKIIEYKSIDADLEALFKKSSNGLVVLS